MLGCCTKCHMFDECDNKNECCPECDHYSGGTCLHEEEGERPEEE